MACWEAEWAAAQRQPGTERVTRLVFACAVTERTCSDLPRHVSRGVNVR